MRDQSSKNHRSIKKKIFFFLIMLVVYLLLSELILSYYIFQRDYESYSSIWLTIHTTIASNILKLPREEKIILTEANPFITTSKDAKMKYHPFIDYTGAHGVYFEGPIDYFGFRNKENLYFDKKDYILVVIAGGSEASGYSHSTTIAENLERILNENSNKTFKVLNLAMNSYTVSNEINAYVQLAYNLKPEFVITHSGWNDLFSGLMVPKNFKKLGLFYAHNQELWLSRLYNLKNAEDFNWPLNLDGKEDIVDKYLMNLEKFKKIVQSNGGQLIVGIQGYDKEIQLEKYPEKKTIYENMIILYKDLNEKSKRKGYVLFCDNKKIKYFDPVHTTNESSEKIAEIYADIILKQMGEKPIIKNSEDTKNNYVNPFDNLKIQNN